MKLTATREEVRQAFLVDDLAEHTQRTFNDLYKEIDTDRAIEITEKVIDVANQLPEEERDTELKRTTFLCKGAYILGYLEADQHHNIVARHAYRKLFDIEGGEA